MTSPEPPPPLPVFPVFDVVLRGFNRAQVQDVLHHLVDLLSDAESRASRG